MPNDNREYLYKYAKRRGIKVYDMSMHEYNFELDCYYSEAKLDEYFEIKEENRQRKLRDSGYRLWK